MDKMVYIGAASAYETMLAQAVNANNLANVSTTAFKAGLVEAQSAYLHGAGADSRAYGIAEDKGVDFAHGALQYTGRSMDMAVNGDGWFAVLADDGTEGYSRRGDFHVTEFGQLLDGAGRQVMGNGGPIAIPPFETMEIGADGTVSVVPLGEPSSTLAVVDRIKLVNPLAEQLDRADNGLMKMINGEDAPANASVRLISGALESSNVNTVEAMVKMIELSRQFETDIRIMKTAEQLDQSSNELMKLS